MTASPQQAKPSAVLVDMDGTLAIITDRSPYSHRGVLKDKPNQPVIDVARALAAAGNRLVIVSGRSELAREETKLWLTRHLGVPFDGPFMRAEGDDRDQVVRMWRRQGLTCLQVAEGNFERWARASPV